MFVETPFDQALVDMLLTTEPPGQYSARNAIRHVDRAAAIATIDPEMAAFRAITGEEESATAVFRAVKRHGYMGATSLKERDHLHKNALSLFCGAVGELLAEAEGHLHLEPQLVITGTGNERRLRTRFRGLGLGLGDVALLPEPPLHWEVTRGGALHDFGEQLDRIADGQRFHSIRAHLQERANQRNQILYAWRDGLPNVALNGFLGAQRGRVRNNLIAFLLIDPYPDHQLFVSQSIRGFLKMLAAFPPDLAF